MGHDDKPFFSIITVCYNSEKTIERTLKSVINQTFDNYEYIIVDGCSTDCTMLIINQYKKQFKSVDISSEPDTGIYDAMNKGILRAKGNIIILLNSDDWLENNALEKIYCASDGNEEIITGPLKFWYDDKHYLTYGTSIARFERLKKKYLSPIRHPATFVPLSVYRKVGLFDTSYKIIGDTDFIYRCIEHNINFKFIEDVLCNMSDGGVSNSFKNLSQRGKERIKFLKSKKMKTIPMCFNLFRYLLFSAIRRWMPLFIINIYNRN